ncbi:hypothetical protein P7K49_009580 [Saguinus oedipus]|uniref:Uncharacterized protein n=1 Tax=Saguinus oedipus TaxID=9490 RepID=A0ABQ9VKE6_SAGOE|nr:hypothetical protein P7K49_009580 [Saguinus oedipus]
MNEMGALAFQSPLAKGHRSLMEGIPMESDIQKNLQRAEVERDVGLAEMTEAGVSRPSKLGLPLQHGAAGLLQSPMWLQILWHALGKLPPHQHLLLSLRVKEAPMVTLHDKKALVSIPASIHVLFCVPQGTPESLFELDGFQVFPQQPLPSGPAREEAALAHVIDKEPGAQSSRLQNGVLPQHPFTAENLSLGDKSAARMWRSSLLAKS